MNKREAKVEAMRIAAEGIEIQREIGNWCENELGNFIYEEEDEDKIIEELKKIEKSMWKRYNKLVEKGNKK